MINWTSKLKHLLFERHHQEKEKESHGLVKKIHKGILPSIHKECLQFNSKRTTKFKIWPKDLNIVKNNYN